MGKISDYTRVLVSKLTDVFACDQTDNGTTETKSATVEQIGTAIGTLQNFADLDTSNKTLVDSINEIASYTPVYGNTASGAIATFDTSLALPLQDLQIAINAVQEAGTPTPSSPKLISGFTGANIKVAGNLLNGNKVQVGDKAVRLGELASNTYSTHLLATTYTISFTRPTSKAFRLDLIDSNNNVTTILPSATPDNNVTFTVSTEGDYCFSIYLYAGIAPTDIDNVMLVAGSEVKPYKPYTTPTTTPITWQDEAGTVYGGSLKIVNGYTNLVDNINYVDLGSLSWNNASGNLSSSSGIASDVKAPSANTQAFNGLCSCYAVAPRTGISDKQISVQTNGNIVISDTAIAGMTGEQVKAYVTGFILVYEVATPVEYTLASVVQPSTILETNNVFTDTNGDTSVVYACSLKDYIDSQ